MPKIVGSNLVVANLINQLIEELVKQGAWFHQDLQIIISTIGELSVKVANNSYKEINDFMSVPIKLMPQLRHYHLTLDSNLQIKCEKKYKEKLLTDNIMMLIIKIYNATNKIQLWEKSYPPYQFYETKELFHHLFDIKTDYNFKIQKYIQLYHTQGLNQFLLHSFLGSRHLWIKKEQIETLGFQTEQSWEPVLMPIIDFLNHSSDASDYNIDENNKQNIMLKVSGIPDQNSNELFVNYNKYFDIKSTYSRYGFIDTKTKLLASIPLKINFDAFEFIIEHQLDRFSKKISIQQKNLKLFIPEIIKTNQTIKVNKLIIPDHDHPKILRKILSIVIKESIHLKTKKEQIILLLKMEQEILKINKMYWEKAQTLLNKAQIKKQLSNTVVNRCQLTIDFALKHLNNYEKLHLSK